MKNLPPATPPPPESLATTAALTSPAGSGSGSGSGGSPVIVMTAAQKVYLSPFEMPYLPSLTPYSLIQEAQQRQQTLQTLIQEIVNSAEIHKTNALKCRDAGGICAEKSLQ